MNQQEAEKLANAPMEDNYVTFDIGYSQTIILPHKQGMELVKALGHAEIYKSEYNKDPVVLPVKADSIQIKFVAADTYKEARLRQYLEGE